MRAPSFWKEKSALSTLLLPVAAVYGTVSRLRAAQTPQAHVAIPVICIGNIVAGGAGKTPVALKIGAMLKAQGIDAHFLSRGYGGNLKGPVRVDVHTHSAQQVGDEPLLLAELLPTWVAKDRVRGAKEAEKKGAEVIIMDDGFQNPALHKDYAVLVVDGDYGFGNDRIIPAGPLRESVYSAMHRASLLLIMGEDRQNILKHAPATLAVMHGKIKPSAATSELQGKAVIAFAGIARPRKFYRTLQEIGCDICQMVSYPDHYSFTAKDTDYLCALAVKYNAQLVTTAKDYVRLPLSMRPKVTIVPVVTLIEDEASLSHSLLTAIGRS